MMKEGKVVLVALAIAIMAVSSVGVYELYHNEQPGCARVEGVARAQVTQTSFGAVTEYKLPGGDVWPNAIAVAPDGSAWFAVQEIPGVAHLYPGNGTLVEYPWPGYAVPKPPDCVPTASSSGMALWNGRVWTADEFSNAIWGVNPSDGSTQLVNVTGKAELPYWLAAGPDGALWFTSDNTPARLGRILPNMTLEVVSLSGIGRDQPLQLDFVNSSLAFLSAINLSTNSTTHSCACDGHIYSFDPGSASGILAVSRVGGDYHLELPTSVSYSNGSVWVAQHGASSVVRYDFADGTWTAYPTSLIPWSATTLPLEVKAVGSKVWFNEHYANKIALVDAANGTLTEYSESLAPASNYTDIQNDLSIALSGSRLWFTSLSGNYVGFVDAEIKPSFYVSFLGTNRLNLAPGDSANLTLRIYGAAPSPLKVNVSDSENSQSVPKAIHIHAVVLPKGPDLSAADVGVTVTLGQGLRPGDYTIGVTVSDGILQQTAYVFVSVA